MQMLHAPGRPQPDGQELLLLQASARLWCLMVQKTVKGTSGAVPEGGEATKVEYMSEPGLENREEFLSDDAIPYKLPPYSVIRAI